MGEVSVWRVGPRVNGSKPARAETCAAQTAAVREQGTRWFYLRLVVISGVASGTVLEKGTSHSSRCWDIRGVGGLISARALTSPCTPASPERGPGNFLWRIVASFLITRMPRFLRSCKFGCLAHCPARLLPS